MKRAVIGYQAGLLGLTELSSWYGVEPETLRRELGEPAAAGNGASFEDEWDLDAPLFPESGEDALA